MADYTVILRALLAWSIAEQCSEAKNKFCRREISLSIIIHVPEFTIPIYVPEFMPAPAINYAYAKHELGRELKHELVHKLYLSVQDFQPQISQKPPP